jgi:hypothetical protein
MVGCLTVAAPARVTGIRHTGRRRTILERSYCKSLDAYSILIEKAREKSEFFQEEFSKRVWSSREGIDFSL